MEGGRWRWNPFKFRLYIFSALLYVYQYEPRLCSSLNTEGLALLRFRERVIEDPFGALSSWRKGDGELYHCSWSGVECCNGKVITLNLRDLCLQGSLGPELGQFSHIKSIILRNNSFSGNVPREIGKLEGLEVLDLGFNNFTGPFLLDNGNNLSLTILLLDNNEYIGGMPPEIYDLKMLSEFQLNDRPFSDAEFGTRCNCRPKFQNTIKSGDVVQRRLLNVFGSSIPATGERNNIDGKSSRSSSPSPSRSTSPSSSPSLTHAGPPHLSISIPPSTSVASPSVSPSPSPTDLLTPSPSPVSLTSPFTEPSENSLNPSKPHNPQQTPYIRLPPPASAPRPSVGNTTKSSDHMMLILSGAVGGSLLILALAICFINWRRNKLITVKPWATGLSGQLQKAFVTGVTKLQRSELETACEDFSNIIGSLPYGNLYKGTLSGGVEIAVTSTEVKSAEDWSDNLEAQFRNKIEMLSKLNHKNFVNLIGYCEEEDPFTRMMVFEYAPNGTLFEHLHIRESEHLDWGMRLRIAMGVAYCLEYMHQLVPSMAHKNVRSSSIYLTEDYAAKISDFSLWNKARESILLDVPSANLESNVYSFGLILFEMITGRLPDLNGSESIASLAADLPEGRSYREIIDPTFKSYQEEELEQLIALASDCLHPDARQRPRMGEITAKLREITTMGPEGASPKSSPLWWAELEIMSTESS